ncbi:glycoside hydrolase family 75 protein [Lophium mytilinum]|uniref:Endo-chitosanase n=1 Tax=Lophium mytilinum TaxID=390894 RepID=A0A6A6RFC5_9PEZI|nr:glycoside hydrolase family 75 protein [Lophium mytilinum]
MHTSYVHPLKKPTSHSLTNPSQNTDCSNPISDSFSSVVYCQDDASGALFLKGPSGSYDNMDIDCDGANASEGLCDNDPTGQSMTAFMDQVAEFGISDLDAHIHTYVVLGNEGATPSFDPQSVGIEPLSVVAVVCNGKMFYGVWGDTNGGTSTGEAALSMGQLCFGDDAVNGNEGHDEANVLYVAFPGSDAVPGKSAAWKAETEEEFEESLAAIGDKLIANL